ncbi:hypothetical protein KC734_07455 [candidate division KSB1 bacterium]|nr:hypothetical protein [candidate division KSB1 bacterium]
MNRIESEIGLTFFAILVVFFAYVFIASIIEGLKNKFHWRWGLIILFALHSFYVFGSDSGTFQFMWDKAKEFIESPPWSDSAEQPQQ